MNKLKKAVGYFTKFETGLWLSSIVLILASFLIFDRSSYLTLIASLIGATSLIFCAKGNPFGQLLMVIFGLLYGVISFSFRYYGEMITYIGMTVPMAAVSLVTWLRNPYNGNHSEVKIHRISKKELAIILLLTAGVTVASYFVLDTFGTSNLIPSTFSVSTSFFAVCLTARRSPYFALAYALNDVVLIVLWVLACISDISYLSIVVCFIMFLMNDSYSFINWKRMQKKQAE